MFLLNATLLVVLEINPKRVLTEDASRTVFIEICVVYVANFNIHCKFQEHFNLQYSPLQSFKSRAFVPYSSNSMISLFYKPFNFLHRQIGLKKNHTDVTYMTSTHAPNSCPVEGEEEEEGKKGEMNIGIKSQESDGKQTEEKESLISQKDVPRGEKDGDEDEELDEDVIGTPSKKKMNRIVSSSDESSSDSDEGEGNDDDHAGKGRNEVQSKSGETHTVLLSSNKTIKNVAKTKEPSTGSSDDESEDVVVQASDIIKPGEENKKSRNRKSSESAGDQAVPSDDENCDEEDGKEQKEDVGVQESSSEENAFEIEEFGSQKALEKSFVADNASSCCHSLSQVCEYCSSISNPLSARQMTCFELKLLEGRLFYNKAWVGLGASMFPPREGTSSAFDIIVVQDGFPKI